MSLPVRSLDQVYPGACFFCARTTRQMMRWNVANASRLPSYRLDATPAQLIGIAGQIPFVAHEAASSPAALDFLQSCGLPAPENLHRYRTVEEASDIALTLIGQGLRLVHNFGTLPAVESTQGLLIPMHQYLRLNAKGSLPQLVKPQWQPERRTVTVAQLLSQDADSFEFPLYLKLAGEYSNGGGGAVKYCADATALHAAGTEFAERLDEKEPVVAERDYGDVPSWCAGVAVLDDKVEWLGASLQMFSRQAVQSGSVLFADQPPRSLQQVSCEIAEVARGMGYRGLAGFDIGLPSDSDPIVFDLNFRPNSSSALLLAGVPALKQSGYRVAHSFFLRHDGPLNELLDSLAPEAGRGRVIPGSLFDREIYKRTLDDRLTRSCADGYLLADSIEDARTQIAEIRGRL